MDLILFGPPGAGKSSLIGAMVTVLRQAGSRVAVLAVDPSSPVSGGAVLGDRTRMGVHTCDPGVFIRSIASRGYAGGLARAVPALGGRESKARRREMWRGRR
jgi:LAO/AO transport system kinase